MTPQPIAIGGKRGTVVYLDAQWQPVPVKDAVLAKVVFADGSVGFYAPRKP
jgi:hypothetical protein